MYNYFVAFLTAFLTFISPCVLPLLPVFVSYFAASETDADVEAAQKEASQPSLTTDSVASTEVQDTVAAEDEATNIVADTDAAGEEDNATKVEETVSTTITFKKKSFFARKKRTMINALGFSLGVFVILMLLGVIFALIGASLGSLLNEKRYIINIVTGSIVVIMGLAFMEVIKIPFLTGGRAINVKTANMKFLSAFIFGLVYALSFGPCSIMVGSVNIAAIINEAIKYGEVFKALTLQIVYASTFSLLFIISALLIDQLKGTFAFIKRNYKTFNLVAGIILIILGILLATGVIERLSGWLTNIFY